MGVYVELETVYRLGGERHHQATVYSQPNRDHLIAEIYHHLWESKTWRILRLFEGALMRRHTRACEGCVTGYSPEGKAVSVCAYIPITARQDLRCYDLKNRRRSDFVSLQLSAKEYAQVAHLDSGRRPDPAAIHDPSDGLRTKAQLLVLRKRFLSRRPRVAAPADEEQ